MRYIYLLATLFCTSVASFSQDLTGTWEGKYVDEEKPQLDRIRFRCFLRLKKATDTSYMGILTIKNVGLNSLANGGVSADYLLKVKHKNNTVSFADLSKMSTDGRVKLSEHISSSLTLTGDDILKGRLYGKAFQIPSAGDIELKKKDTQISSDDIALFDKYSTPDVELVNVYYRTTNDFNLSNLFVTAQRKSSPVRFNETGMFVINIKNNSSFQQRSLIVLNYLNRRVLFTT